VFLTAPLVCSITSNSVLYVSVVSSLPCYSMLCTGRQLSGSPLKVLNAQLQYVKWAGLRSKDQYWNSTKALDLTKAHIRKVLPASGIESSAWYFIAAAQQLQAGRCRLQAGCC
jgi:hypothetical protein